MKVQREGFIIQNTIYELDNLPVWAHYLVLALNALQEPLDSLSADTCS